MNKKSSGKRSTISFFWIFIFLLIIYSISVNAQSEEGFYDYHPRVSSSTLDSGSFDAGSSKEQIYNGLILSADGTCADGVECVVTLNLNATYYSLSPVNISIPSPTNSFNSPRSVVFTINGDDVISYSGDQVCGSGTGYTAYISNDTLSFPEGFVNITITWSNIGSPCADKRSTLRELWFKISEDDNSNDLPSCFFYIPNSDKCYESEGVTYDLNISCTDNENDTIYYSMDTFNFVRRLLFFEENFLDGESLDFDFFNRQNFIYNRTDFIRRSVIETGIQILAGELGDYRYTPYLTKLTTGGSIYGQLNINDQVDNFLIVADEPYESGILVSNRYIMDLNTPVFDSLYVDSVYNTILNISYNQSIDNLTVYIEGTEVINRNHNLSIEQELYVNVVFNDTESRAYVTISWDDGDEIFRFYNNYSIDFDNWYGIRYNTIETDSISRYIIGRILTEGINYELSPSFSTIKPTSITINETGNTHVDLYVTDSANLGSAYVTNSTIVYLSIGQQCGINFQPEGIVTSPDIDELFSGLKVFELAIIEALTITGVSEIVWIYVFLIAYNFFVVLACYGIYLLTLKTKEIAFVFFWLSNAFGHLFLVYPTWLSYFIVVMCALSLVIGFVGWLKARNSEGDE